MEPTEIIDAQSVGQEFIEWAEKYWGLKNIVNIDSPDTSEGESCNYEYMRNVFIEKINFLMKQRLGI